MIAAMRRASAVSIAVIGIALLGGFLYWWQRQSAEEYDPVIDPSSFVPSITNPYFTLVPGTKYFYESRTTDGVERIEVEVTGEQKQVLGIPVTVVRDRVYLDDVLVEDTGDWYAQDASGTVWYFGEDVSNYENGKLKDHAGAWEAGVDGAKPGIVMLADPKTGDSYRQEYYRGKAEDMADVVALEKAVAVPYGSFTDCLQTRDWSKIETTLQEYKYYCPAAGFLVKEENMSDSRETAELVNITK